MLNEDYSIKFPVWDFLNQELFKQENPLILNPHRFWYVYRINLLEKCLKKECDSKGTTS
jgi:hypothetical protein